ncbi:hypothetical protein [Exiguobacterium algae]|uniref:hypothetical protein n=1 Tax=Exiguobacterium algae TaxID=2751250 RepID=UPI001BE8DC56|nr:hypothetical protein [Exiguobacterium algae]
MKNERKTESAIQGADEVAATSEIGAKGASKGVSDYRETFFTHYPETRGKVVVHHAIEQQVLKRYPNLITKAEMHSIGNLRGIPKELNSDIHLSKIRKDWNKFYRENPNATREELDLMRDQIDKKYGGQFNPPIK